MTLDQFGTLANIVATLAVLATLLFLALQIRGETTARRAQTRQELANARRATILLHLQEPEVRRIRRKSRIGEPILEDEEEVLMWIGAMTLREFENFVYQHQLGTLDSVEMESARALLRVQLKSEEALRGIIEELTQGFEASYTETMKNELRDLGLLGGKG